MDKIVFFSGVYVINLVKLFCHGPIRQLQSEDGLKRKAKTCSCQCLFKII